MRELLLAGFVCLLLSALIAADSIDVVEFDQSALIINAIEQKVSTDGAKNIDREGLPSLPVVTRNYSATGNHSLDLNVNVLSADTINLAFSPAVMPHDLTTALEPKVVPCEIEDYTGTTYPANSDELSKTLLDGSTVWSVNLYPVQYLPGNQIIFNRVFSIESGDPSIQIANRLPMKELDKSSPRQYALSGAPGQPLSIEYVVVTSDDLAPAYNDFVTLKRQTGFSIEIALIDTIVAYYPGLDDAEALRNYLIEVHNTGGRFVLLGGDETVLPIRHAYYYNTGLTPDLYNLAICDLYFADVNGKWDVDGDNIWGEPTQDQPDIGMDLWVGRLPFSRTDQVEAYTRKLEAYLFKPGNNDLSYLNRSIYFSSDQLRDYIEGGQQYAVANEFPAHISSDCEALAEQTTGSDPAPVGPTAQQTRDVVSTGAGFVNVLAHGRPDGFALNSSGYNENPKTYILTANGNGNHAEFNQLEKNNNVGFYYSIACDQGMFDVEAVHGTETISMVEGILEADSSGAIGIIAFTRWGWVSSSYKLMSSFYRNLFDSADGYPIDAMQRSMLEFPYYRDQIYGQNYFGDPSIRLYTDQPYQIEIDAPSHYHADETVVIGVSSGGQFRMGIPVTAMIGSDIIAATYTNIDGDAFFELPDGILDDVSITAYWPGRISEVVSLSPGIIADADDDDNPLPYQFALKQNYPNPFNPTTTISYSLPKAADVQLVIYDILGQEVVVLEDNYVQPGEHDILWDGRNSYGEPTASGIYFYRIKAGEFVATSKMLLLK